MKRIIIFSILAVFFVSCNDDFLVQEGVMRGDLMKMSEVDRTKMQFSPEEMARLYRYKYKHDKNDFSLTRKERKIMRELYKLSVPEAFVNEENEVRKQLNKIGDMIDSFHWNDIKQYLFTGTYMTIKEFKNSLPAGYILENDYTIINKNENKEIALSDFLLEYNCCLGQGGS